MRSKRRSRGPVIQHSCGCMTGMISVIATIAWYITTGAGPAHDVPSRIAVGAAYALTAAVIGKLVGISWSIVHPRRPRVAKQAIHSQRR